MNYDMNHDDAISQCKIEQLRYRELTMPPCHYTYVKVHTHAPKGRISCVVDRSKVKLMYLKSDQIRLKSNGSSARNGPLFPSNWSTPFELQSLARLSQCDSWEHQLEHQLEVSVFSESMCTAACGKAFPPPTLTGWHSKYGITHSHWETIQNCLVSRTMSTVPLITNHMFVCGQSLHQSWPELVRGMMVHVIINDQGTFLLEHVIALLRRCIGTMRIWNYTFHTI